MIMNIKYYTKFFSFGLPTYMVGCLLFACSKLNGSYDYYKRKINPDSGEDRPSKRSKPAIPSASSLSQLTQELFEAIQQSNVNEVKKLLQDKFFEGVGIVNLCETDPDGNTCLHIAASINKGNENAEATIMAFLLDKMRPLLLSKNSIDICKIKGKLLDSLKGWKSNEDDIETENTKIQQERSNSNSELLRKSYAHETPLMVAMKKGNLSVLKCLLQTTHKCAGFQLTCHNNKDKLDFLDIALSIAIQSKDDAKLDLVLDEFKQCITLHPYSHFGNTKCMAEQQALSFFTSKSKLLFNLACREETSDCYKKLLKKINNIVGFSDFIFSFLRFHTTNKGDGYLLRFMQHNLPKDEFKSKMVQYLSERLSLNNSPELMEHMLKFVKKCSHVEQFRTSSETWRPLLTKLREEYAKDTPSNESTIHVKGTIKVDIYDAEQEFELLMKHFHIDYKSVYEFHKEVLHLMLYNTEFQ